MKMKIKPATGIEESFDIPGDKSISHRSLILGSIAEGQSRIKGLLEGEDCFRTLEIMKQLGVRIEKEASHEYRIFGRGLEGLTEPSGVLDCGNSGTSMRLIAGLLAGRNFYSVLSGDGSLRERPMNRIRRPLEMMGAEIWCRSEGLAPLSIKGGNLRGIEYKPDVASAQVKSSILLAGLSAEGETAVREPAVSRDHTERMLQAAGVDIEKNGNTITLAAGPQSLKPLDIEIPGDISSAAFIISAGLIVPGAEITVTDCGINPTRSGFLDVLDDMQADLTYKNRREIGGEPAADIKAAHSQLEAVEIEGDIIPRMVDEVPVLAVLATQARGSTVIRDAEELRYKETDRLTAISQTLKEMGAEIEEREDGLVIEGPTSLRGGVELDSFQDHRIAMALAVAGLAADSPLEIKNSEVVDISFPGFADIINRFFQEE